jgi:phage-related protein
MTSEIRHKRRWRLYETSTGSKPVVKFLDALTDEDLADVFAAMDEVEENGVRAARHLADEIYEVRADGRNQTYRLLFAREGRHKHILLGLVAFAKTTQKTPGEQIELAKSRLADWHKRAKLNPEPRRKLRSRRAKT